MIRKILMGTALTGALATSAFATSAIQFDYDGAGGAAPIWVDTLDWQPGNALSDNGSVAPTVAGGNSVNPNGFQTYYQAALGTLLFTDAAGFTTRTTPTAEFTIVAGFREAGFAAGNTAQFFLQPGGNNFVEIYYDATPDANNLAGTGFNDGLKIFGGNVVALSGQTNFTIALAPTGTGDVLADFPVGYQDQVVNNLDRFGPTNNYPTVGTVVGSGASDLVVAPNYIDPNFFTNNVLPTLIVSMMTNTSLVDPFNQTNPSAQFYTGGGFVNPQFAPVLPGTVFPGTTLAGVTHLNGGPIAVGDTNEYDFIFQADGNSSFNVVPEPGTMVLLGSGLMGLAGVARRRTKKS